MAVAAMAKIFRAKILSPAVLFSLERILAADARLRDPIAAHNVLTLL
jgi:hypothetical protein